MTHKSSLALKQWLDVKRYKKKGVVVRVVTKISRCRVKPSKQGIKQLEVSFGSIFLLLSFENRRGPLL